MNHLVLEDFRTLKKNLRKDYSGFKSHKVAVLGDFSTQLLTKAIKGYGYVKELNFNLYEEDYDQIDQAVFNLHSTLYEAKPEIVVIIFSPLKLWKKYYQLPIEDKAKLAERILEKIETLYDTLFAHLNAKVLVSNYFEFDTGVFGNFGNSVSNSFLYQIRKINFELMNLAQRKKNLFINDLNQLVLKEGIKQVIDPKLHISADMVFSLDFLPKIAKNIVDITLATVGKIKKCLILDLDNTVWGGVIGDDGMEKIQVGDLGIGKAFSELQMWAKELRNRGIILAVCSKNTEEIAREPFEKHPDMILRMDDISIFVANWENKARNIKYIQEVLNIGFDSMVFVDDNPVERDIVRQMLPEVTVPEMPVDPAEYVPYLISLNLFETVSYSQNDQNRTQQYQAEAQRVITKKTFGDENDYLASLEMTSEVSPFNSFNIPRVAQLTQRSNQFNFRTIRYTEEDVKKLSESNTHFTFSFTLTDKFGNAGIISAIILEKKDATTLFIDTWVMSCRVLKRGMEDFIISHLVAFCQEKRFKKLIGEHIPTRKNVIVKDLYREKGFTEKDGLWHLEVDNYASPPCFIKKK